MRLGRGSAATLKTALSNLRSKIPDTQIIVLEGKDDVPVFETWIKRASERFSWEPFVAHGKRNALALRGLLQRDETGLFSRVSFIIDHDYDGLGDQPDGSDVYVLPGYSIENFIATEQALEYFLKATLQLHSQPELRLQAREFFAVQIDKYCQHLVPACAILWAARRSGARGVEAGDAVIDNFDFVPAGIELKPDRDLAALIKFDGEVDPNLIRDGENILSSQDTRLWIRGKYVYSFFEKCCSVLHGDIISQRPHIFSASVKCKLDVGSTNLSRLASAVELPQGLRERVEHWAIA